MIYKKSVLKWGRNYTRKDRRSERVGVPYASHFHYSHSSRLKKVRKVANGRVRRYKGDVSDYSWYKRVDEVWYVVF